MTSRIVIIGDTTRAEFRAIVDYLSSLAGSQSFTTISSAVADVKSADLVVVLESHPDEYSVAEIESLYAPSPLARVVCCYGPWSESAGRTRKLWPVALRIPAIAAVARLEREWWLITQGPTEFWLPATGNREETFAAQFVAAASSRRARGQDAPATRMSVERSPPLPDPLPRGGGEGTKQKIAVRVISPDADYRAMLVDLLRGVGWSVDNARADVAIWDADPWHAGRTEEVRALAGTTAVIAVSGWITPEVEAEILDAGARSVAPKLGNQRTIVEMIASLGVG